MIFRHIFAQPPALRSTLYAAILPTVAAPLRAAVVFEEQLISANANYPYSVSSADIDGEGDIDLFSASGSDDKIAWYKRLGEPPLITSAATVNVPENTTAVLTITATGSDPLTFAISGGADQSQFAIDPLSGELAFISPPDFENPSDAGVNNFYNIEITVSDGGGIPAVQQITIAVTGIPEPQTDTDADNPPGGSNQSGGNDQPQEDDQSGESNQPKSDPEDPVASSGGGALAWLSLLVLMALTRISRRDFDTRRH